MAEEPEQTQAEPETDEPQETDWKAEARKWQKRSQENYKKAKAYDDLQEQSKSDLQKAQEKAQKLQKELDDLNAKSAKDAARVKVAKETGVPEDLIAGDNEDSMRAFAKSVAKFAKKPAAPKASNPGSFANDAGDSKDAEKRAFARQVFGSNN